MITTDKVAEFTNLLRKAINSDSNLTDEFAVPLSTLLKDMMDGEGGGGGGDYIQLEPSEGITLRREGEDEDIAIGDTVTVEELIKGVVNAHIVNIEDEFAISPGQFADNDVLEEITLNKAVVKGNGYYVAYTFYNCPNLKKVDITFSGAEPFEAYALFAKCQNLEYVNVKADIMPGTPVIMGGLQWWTDCNSLKEVILDIPYTSVPVPPTKCLIVRIPQYKGTITQASYMTISDLLFMDLPSLEQDAAFTYGNLSSTIRGLRLGKLTNATRLDPMFYEYIGLGKGANDLYYLHILNNFDNDMDLRLWKPINALSEGADLVEWQEWDLEADGETPIDCTQFQNNKEKFLYCFRNLTLPAFENTGETKNLTLSQEMYDVLSQEQDIMDFFTQNNWNVQIPQ